MSSGAPPLLRTALNDVHRRLGARMVDFAGWDMPVQYPSGIIAEHQAVRTAAGLFDLSHMGRVFVRGPDALGLSQACFTRDLRRIRAGEAAYGLLCTEPGGIVDDVIAYVLGDDEVLFVFNASNREHDVAFFVSARDAHQLDAEIDDQTHATALLGLQGPDAQNVLQRLCTNHLEALPGYAFVSGVEVAGRSALVSRTGYTGEDGFEIMLNRAQDAEHVWGTLLNMLSVTACGLGARDTLRTEAGFALYGHEIDETTTPYQARLGWVVNLHKCAEIEFVGCKALASLKERGPERLLVGLSLAPGGGVPRPGFPILHHGTRVGQLTSGTFSPTLQKPIALGYVQTALAQPDQALEIEIRGKPLSATVTKLPFVPHRSRPRAKM
jgi:aminomethyltransferase